MKYFNSIKDLTQLRNRYKTLLKTCHPDNGGDEETCKQINLEYKETFERLKDAAFSDAAGDEKATRQAARMYNWQEDEKLRETVEKIIHMENINIEVVGCWIWIDGATLPVKDALKKYGFAWSKARKKWHYSPYESRGYRRGTKNTFDQIRKKYGSEELENEKQKKIA